MVVVGLIGNSDAVPMQIGVFCIIGMNHSNAIEDLINSSLLVLGAGVPGATPLANMLLPWLVCRAFTPLLHLQCVMQRVVVFIE